MTDGSGTGIRAIWRAALRDPAFRRVLVSLLGIGTGLLVAYSFLLSWVERRPGVVLADPVLAAFDPVDVTWITFGLIYGACVVALVDMARRPWRLLAFGGAYEVLLLARALTLWLTPLDPPLGTIPLKDPIVHLLVDGRILTRDLFFSGHTATTLVLGLSMAPGRMRTVVILLAPVVGSMTMLQHVHYTVDVVAAFPVAWAAYGLTAPWRRRGAGAA